MILCVPIFSTLLGCSVPKFFGTPKIINFTFGTNGKFIARSNCEFITRSNCGKTTGIHKHSSYRDMSNQKGLMQNFHIMKMPTSYYYRPLAPPRGR